MKKEFKMVQSILLKITFPEHFFIELVVHHLAWRQDTQQNNTQHNDTEHNNTQHNTTQNNDTQRSDTQHNNISNVILSLATSSMMTEYSYADCQVSCILSVLNKLCMLGVFMLSVIMLNVVAQFKLVAIITNLC